MPRGLQEWIHLLEEGAWKKHVKLATLILAFAGLAAFYDIRQYKCFATQEAMEMAQLGRNVAAGQGFTTGCIRPLLVHLLEGRSGGNDSVPVLQKRLPDLTYPPVYPLLLAGLMKLIPFHYAIPTPTGVAFERYQPELLIDVFNQALFALGIVGAFFLARRLFDFSVGLLTALLLAGAALLWSFTLSGLPTMLLIDLFLLLVGILVEIEQKNREGSGGGVWITALAAAAGAVVGAGGMTVYSFGWLIIPTLFYLGAFCAGRRWPAALAAALAFTAVMTPWLVRNYQSSGTLFGTAGYSIDQGTVAFPDNRLERTLSGEFESGLNHIEMADYFRKFFVNAADIVQNELPKLGGSWITGFFLAGLLLPFRNAAISRLRYYVLACLATLTVVEALGRTHLWADHPTLNSENLLIWLAPLVFIFGVALYYMVTDLIDFPAPQLRFALTSLFVLVISAPMMFKFLPPRPSPLAWPPYYPPLIQETAHLLNPDELMMSDMPWAVAWYGQRTSIWLTLDAPMDSHYSASGDFFTINDFQKTIQGLYLTQLTTDLPFLSGMVENRDGIWGRFFLDCLERTNVSTVFPLKYARDGLLPKQMFLTDHRRWRRSSGR